MTALLATVIQLIVKNEVNDYNTIKLDKIIEIESCGCIYLKLYKTVFYEISKIKAHYEITGLNNNLTILPYTIVTLFVSIFKECENLLFVF